MLDFNQFEFVSFDCYGTLINWESGILPVLRRLLSAREIDFSARPDLEMPDLALLGLWCIRYQAQLFVIL